MSPSSDAEDCESEIRVGFVTYSNVLHFYNLKVSLFCYVASVLDRLSASSVEVVQVFVVTVSVEHGYCGVNTSLAYLYLDYSTADRCEK